MKSIWHNLQTPAILLQRRNHENHKSRYRIWLRCLDHSVWPIQFLPCSCCNGDWWHDISKQSCRANLGTVLCPAGTAEEAYSYATTTIDEYGNSQPSRTYELHCVDKEGTVVKEDLGPYAYLWIGIVTAIGPDITARNKKPNVAADLEPK